MGSKNIVITGLELKKKIVSDFIMAEKPEFLEKRKIKTITHGSGCNYSASMLFSMVQGRSILESAKFAQKFTWDSIKNAQQFGKGVVITHRDQDPIRFELSNAIDRFTKIQKIYQRIPECQTNFVFSKKNPKSIKDILGISGRIVKNGVNVTKIGGLEYGGSKHVAMAALIMNKKFPAIRSALNLKFQKETIDKLNKNEFIVKNYDRTKEPKSIKNKEGSSIEWGINKAIKDSKIPPDAIFHKGDFGKEPMIIIFGTSPNTIIEKISSVY
jgi:hydroxymethylpyrimidine/phosphomethylpyrimidine kinase